MNRHFDRTGIMFSHPFPTLSDLEREYAYFSEMPTGVAVPEELANWLAIAVDPRGYMYGDDDTEAMDETNFAALVDAVDTTDGNGIPWVRSDYGFRNGWVVSGVSDAVEAGVCHYGRILAIDPANEVAVEAAESCDRALSDYPLLDDSAYSEREWDAWMEYAPMAYSDEIRDANRSGRMTDEVAEQLEDSADELLPALAQHLHYSHGFTGEYGPEFLDILGDAIRSLFPPAYRFPPSLIPGTDDIPF